MLPSDRILSVLTRGAAALTSQELHAELQWHDERAAVAVARASWMLVRMFGYASRQRRMQGAFSQATAGTCHCELLPQGADITSAT